MPNGVMTNSWNNMKREITKKNNTKKEITKRNVSEAREELRKWLVDYTGCDIQEGEGGGWPCGTCACDLLGSIGLTPSNGQYAEHNKPVDRINEVWRAILQIRDAKL